MKLIFIVYNISIEEEVQQLLQAQGVKSFTQWPRLIGVGELAGARLDNGVWPGANSAIVAVVPDEQQASSLMSAVRALRAGEGRREGIEAFQLNVEDTTLTSRL
ncbi:MAG: hypothetical protein IKR13_02045 [Victivallales bacterium]|nr:hypothetical protein [Victivallales bacterium]